MMAGSIQLLVLSQLRLCEMPAGPEGPPMWLTLLEDEEDEEEEQFGNPPKLMLMFGRRALRPSCHSFTFKPSIEPLFSVETGQEQMFDHSNVQTQTGTFSQDKEMVPEMGIPPRPVLCWGGRLRSRKLLCETALAEWFKCVRLFLVGTPIQGCLVAACCWLAWLFWLLGKLKEL